MGGDFEYKWQQNIICRRSGNFALKRETPGKLLFIMGRYWLTFTCMDDAVYFICPAHRTVPTSLTKCLYPATEKQKLDPILDL